MGLVLGPPFDLAVEAFDRSIGLVECSLVRWAGGKCPRAVNTPCLWGIENSLVGIPA